MSELLLSVETDLSPAESIGATHYLLEAVSRGRTNGASWLLLSRPAGRALTLGRFQDERSAVNFETAKKQELEIVRRVSGGTACLLSAKQLHFALCVPLKEGPLDCEPRQFLQKYGTVVVKSLSALGLHARYFGRDLISLKDNPVALLSFEITRSGVGLLEAVIGVEASVLPAPELSGYSNTVRETPSTESYTCLTEELENISAHDLIEKIRASAPQKLELSATDRTLTPLEKERARSLLRKVCVKEPQIANVPSYLRRWRSRTVEESIGFVEATVGVTQGRFLKDVNIHGDFMADSPGIEDLEQKLRMTPIKRRQVALIIDDVLGSPEHVILGIRRLGSILEAIMDAAKKGAAEAEG
jgi:lipoate-protein ligase A